MFNFIKKLVSRETYPELLNWGTYDTPKWSSTKDEQYVREGFNKIVWVYACAQFIAQNTSKANWELWRIGKGKNTKDTQIYDHPALDLMSGNVNTHFSTKDFIELWALGLALQGKFFANLNSPVYPTKIYPLYSHRVKPIPNKKLFVSSFEYEVNGKNEIYKENEILWSKFNDPLDFYEGLSPIKAAARTVDTENKTVDWNKSMMDNVGIPPGAIQVENPSPDLNTKLKTEWRKKYAGPKNARVPMILNSQKANYISFGINQVDADFIQQKLNNRIEICAVFTLPPQVVGDNQSQTFSNYEQASKSAWEQCIIPIYLDRMKDDLNLYIAKRYADNLEFRYNLDDISVLHESNDGKMKRAVDGYTKGVLKLNEARDVVGYDEVEDGDKFIEKPDMSEEKEPKEDKKKHFF